MKLAVTILLIGCDAHHVVAWLKAISLGRVINSGRVKTSWRRIQGGICDSVFLTKWWVYVPLVLKWHVVGAVLLKVKFGGWMATPTGSPPSAC